MAHKLTFHPLARTDLFDLYRYIEEQAGSVRAGGYLDRIENLCANLSAMPERGTDRRDLGVGIRTIALERRLLVVYRTSPAAVEVLRILYAGRDFSGDDLPN